MKPMLSIENLSVAVDDKPILTGLSLDVPAGEVHAIMGPNGAGKSTLSYALAGRPGYEVTGGSARLDGEDLLALDPSQRAAKGLFLSFQYPIEIPGVPALTFLRTALNAQHKARSEPEISAPDFLRLVRGKAAALKMDFDMLKRSLNVGFSGGEKKRMEILQMAVLSPRLAILDETDSGLDIDALRIVSEGVNAMRAPNRAMLVITHYQRLLDYIRPDRVHVLSGGTIVASGGPELALELEREGYDKYARVAA
jgi:Fe-S cluster assembly ATP-binding protein